MALHVPDDERDKEEDWGDDATGYDEATEPCPYCKKLIPEDTPHCPYCGHYISEEDAPPQQKPWWIIVGALACLVVVYFWIMH